MKAEIAFQKQVNTYNTVGYQKDSHFYSFSIESLHFNSYLTFVKILKSKCN